MTYLVIISNNKIKISRIIKSISSSRMCLILKTSKNYNKINNMLWFKIKTNISKKNIKIHLVLKNINQINSFETNKIIYLLIGINNNSKKIII